MTSLNNAQTNTSKAVAHNNSSEKIAPKALPSEHASQRFDQLVTAENNEKLSQQGQHQQSKQTAMQAKSLSSFHQAIADDPTIDKEKSPLGKSPLDTLIINQSTPDNNKDIKAQKRLDSLPNTLETINKETTTVINMSHGDKLLHNISTDPVNHNNSILKGTSEINALVQKLADRILIAVPNAAKNSDIRITLKASVLDGTEILINRSQGELHVRLLTTTPEIQTLAHQLRADLHSTLEQKFTHDQVKVSVQGNSTTQEMSQSDNNHEGRSRNPYVLIEEDADNNGTQTV